MSREKLIGRTQQAQLQTAAFELGSHCDPCGEPRSPTICRSLGRTFLGSLVREIATTGISVAEDSRAVMVILLRPCLNSDEGFSNCETTVRFTCTLVVLAQHIPRAGSCSDQCCLGFVGVNNVTLSCSPARFTDTSASKGTAAGVGHW